MSYENLRVLEGDDEQIRLFLRGIEEGVVDSGGVVMRMTPEMFFSVTRVDPVFGATSKPLRRTVYILDGDPGEDILKTTEEALVVMGSTPKWVGKLPKSFVLTFSRGRPWETTERAITFCQNEAVRRGFVFPQPLAQALVALVGPQPGVLWFEILKLSHLVGSSKAVEPTFLRESAVGLGGAEAAPAIVEALSKKSRFAMAKALVDLQRSAESKPLLALVGYLRSTLLTWVDVSRYRDRGWGSEDIASQMGMHPYRYKMQIIPMLMGWSTQELSDLMEDLGSVEFGCKEGGAVSPLVMLEAVLLLVCQ